MSDINVCITCLIENAFTLLVVTIAPSLFIYWNFDYSYTGALLHAPCFLFHNGSGATSQKFSCFESWGIEASKDKVKTQCFAEVKSFFLIRDTGCFRSDVFLLIINVVLMNKPCNEESPDKHSMVSLFYMYKSTIRDYFDGAFYQKK